MTLTKWMMAAALTLGAASAPAQVAVLSAASGARPAASAALDKSVPRLLTPAEKRASDELPANVRSETPVVPQLRIPLGKTPPAPAGAKPLPAATGAGIGVDDAVARCEAQADATARSECRARLRIQQPAR